MNRTSMINIRCNGEHTLSRQVSLGRRQWRRAGMLAARALLLALVFAAATNVYADSIIVSNTDDTGPDAPAPGSLRAALASAMDGDVIDATGISGIITLMPGGTNSAELLVDKSVTIIGPGPANLTVDANHLSRVFRITPGHTVVIDGLRIVNGNASGVGPATLGGGILNDHSSLTVNNCVLSGNSAESSGGGIFNAGFSSGSATLAIDGCTFSNNIASAVSGAGGGISNSGAGGNAILTVANSTFNGNSANFGGGIQSSSAMARIANSTFSGNSVIGGGGGVSNNHAVLTIANCTFSGNSATVGGGLDNTDGGTVAIGSTILRANTGANIRNGSAGVPGVVNSHGFNLSSDDGGGVLTGPSDQTETDPLLGPLADNGGPTLTHLPLPGSPAIDKGTSDTLVAFGITTDQRGVARTVDDPNIPNAFLGDGTDIGAVEVGPAPPPPPLPQADLLLSLGVDKTSVKQGDQLTYTITIHNLGPDTALNVLINDTLPNGATFVSARADRGSFTAPPPNQTGVVTWVVGDLENGDMEDARLVVKVIVRGKTTMTNAAIAVMDSLDPNPTNNYAAITTTVAAGGGSKK